jgi:hypothetical protein
LRRQVIGQHLEERHRLWQTLQPVKAKVSEADTGRLSHQHGVTGLGGKNDLATPSREADASGGVDDHADISGVGEGGPAAVQADPDAQLHVIRPGPREHAPLHGQRSVEGGLGAAENSEQLVGARVNLATV